MISLSTLLFQLVPSQAISVNALLKIMLTAICVLSPSIYYHQWILPRLDFDSIQSGMVELQQCHCCFSTHLKLFKVGIIHTHKHIYPHMQKNKRNNSEKEGCQTDLQASGAKVLHLQGIYNQFVNIFSLAVDSMDLNRKFYHLELCITLGLFYRL